ncbi:hypothetical protein CMUS01_12941 [Colletotrichum musicola]|uniref:Uncharacterized protein n=1 Tax=Colletotrichum musicola TaxID=2175873 RepID=A0A8H6JGY9_9PEZI|nr:hypothetical protein CMUS01_12941 [Colletotrichum musicola]
MPLYGRPGWWQRIQDSEAVRHFERDGSGPFPLVELQTLSEDRLEHAASPSSSPLSFKKIRVERFSLDCDLLFAIELEHLRDSFPAREFGVVSCIHLLSAIKARRLLESIKPDISRQDEFFDKRLLVYLQCLVQAKKARADHCPPPVISKHESVAATELFSIASSRNAANNRYPAVSKLLLAIGKMNEPCNDLLPDDLVRAILHRCHFKTNLTEELAILLESKAWGGFLKLFGSGPTMGQVNLERLLHGLDNSIKIGRESIELFLHLCVEPGVGEVLEQELRQLEGALELRNDVSSKIIKNYLRSLQGTCAFRSLETLQGPARERQIYSLATTLCGSSPKNHQTGSVPSAANVTFHDDPIWHEPMESSCDMLRKALSRICETNARLATERLKQAQKEHDVIVQEIADNIHETDQACVNITNFLGTRVANRFPIHQCWKHLAPYMMRQRPPGLLERCHAELRRAQSWVKWIDNMRRVFEEYHLTPQAGLGFSSDKIQALSAMESMSRSTSTSTNSTGSSSV